MSNSKYDVDADGIALITWDMPGKSMNVIDTSVMQELDTLVDKVARAADAGAVQRKHKCFEDGRRSCLEKAFGVSPKEQRLAFRSQGSSKADVKFPVRKCETFNIQVFIDLGIRESDGNA